MNLEALCERGYVPDAATRLGIRMRVRNGLHRERRGDGGAVDARQAAFVRSLATGPIAVATATANAQHYEVPSRLFERMLGPWLKYSCCLFAHAETTLDAAEGAMLERTCERAGVADGMRVMDLGCGWGSLSLWLAERYPACRVVAVSNSQSQKALIDARAAQRELSNLEVRTADAVSFEPGERFDRVLSVEMFEHMRNYAALLERICSWLEPGGRLFVHVFCHRELGYHFESGWMAQHFFTGGIMPREDIFTCFPEQVAVQQRWWVDGSHYERTCNAWLERLDAQTDAVAELCRETYGRREATLWVQRWRMFLMACAELFGLDGGRQFGVVHTLMRPAGDG